MKMKSARKGFALSMIIVLGFASAGCASLPKKFIRKKKEPDHKPAAVFLQEEGAYQKQFSNAYYYKTHFTLWRSWHDDIIANLTGNSKKLNRSAEEAYSHLDQMVKYLKPEKAAGLASLSSELGVYRKKFSDGHFTKSDANSMRSDLERIKRQVANDYYFDKVQADLLPDTVDLHE